MDFSHHCFSGVLASIIGSHRYTSERKIIYNLIALVNYAHFIISGIRSAVLLLRNSHNQNQTRTAILVATSAPQL